MANVVKSGSQDGKAISINIEAESKEDAFMQWTERMTEIKEEDGEDVIGFKRVEDESGGDFTIKGEVYVSEED